MGAKKREGVVYSTNPDYHFDNGAEASENKLPPNRQMLYVWLDSRARKGKTVSLVKGFVGNHDDLETLAGELKRLCGTGGSAKDGEIIIQGDFRDKILSYLSGKGYKVKKAGG